MITLFTLQFFLILRFLQKLLKFWFIEIQLNFLGDDFGLINLYTTRKKLFRD